MEIYLDKNKIEEILRLYYSNITKQDCQIVIETSVEYYDGSR